MKFATFTENVKVACFLLYYGEFKDYNLCH